MENLAEHGQLIFNLDKSEVMHFGTSNRGRTYTVNDRALSILKN